MKGEETMNRNQKIYVASAVAAVSVLVAAGLAVWIAKRHAKADNAATCGE